MALEYAPVPFWAKVPHGMWLREATSVAVGPKDEVYVFNRGNVPVIVFDRDGNYLRSWGTKDPFSSTEEILSPYGYSSVRWTGGEFKRPHSVRADPDGEHVWLVDEGGHAIYKTDLDGKEKLKLGGEPAIKRSGVPFNRPTDVAVHPKTGEIFVSDGYGHSKIHRYDPEGKIMNSWGESGTEPGQFNLPHNLAFVGNDHVIVCDRENNRVQVFDLKGELQTYWQVHKAVAVTQKDGNLYIAEQGPAPVQRDAENIGNCVGIWTPYGNQISRLGNTRWGEHEDQFLWPHSVAVDSEGSIYVAEVSWTEVGRTQHGQREMVSLRKWKKVLPTSP